MPVPFPKPIYYPATPKLLSLPAIPSIRPLDKTLRVASATLFVIVFTRIGFLELTTYAVFPRWGYRYWSAFVLLIRTHTFLSQALCDATIA